MSNPTDVVCEELCETVVELQNDIDSLRMQLNFIASTVRELVNARSEEEASNE